MLCLSFWLVRVKWPTSHNKHGYKMLQYETTSCLGSFKTWCCMNTWLKAVPSDQIWKSYQEGTWQRLEKRWVNDLTMCECVRDRDGTILWCINISQYMMFQCVYRYCMLSIDASIHQCIAVYWSIKCSVKSIKVFKNDSLLKMIREEAFTIFKKIVSLL